MLDNSHSQLHYNTNRLSRQVNMRQNIVKLGLNIKARREILQLTQQELADLVGVSLNHIGKIEIAYSKPSLELVIKLADTLKTTVSELCNFNFIKFYFVI